MKYKTLTVSYEAHDLIDLIAKVTKRSKASTVAWLAEQEIHNNPFVYGQQSDNEPSTTDPTDEGSPLLS